MGRNNDGDLLAIVAGAATFYGVSRMVRGLRNSAEEGRRNQAIAEIKTRIREAYPASISETITEAFVASGHDPDFDFEGLATKLLDAKLYQSLFFNVSEQFADYVLAKKTKLRNYGIVLPTAELLARSVEEMKPANMSVEMLVAFTSEEAIDKFTNQFVEKATIHQLDKGYLVYLEPSSLCVLVTDSEVKTFPSLEQYLEAVGSRSMPAEIRFEPVRSEKLRLVAAKAIPLLY